MDFGWQPDAARQRPPVLGQHGTALTQSLTHLREVHPFTCLMLSFMLLLPASEMYQPDGANYHVAESTQPARVTTVSHSIDLCVFFTDATSFDAPGHPNSARLLR